MLIKIDVDSDLYRQIQDLIKEGKYEDIYQFINIAMNNQIQEESAGLKSGQETESVLSIEKSPYPKGKVTMSKDFFDEILEMELDKSEIQPEPEDLIWNFYNRVLPVKLVIVQLASMMSSERKWIEISELQESAFGFAEEIATRLRDYEEDYHIQRNKRLSTGLPMPKTELRGIKGAARRKKEMKLQASRIRFTEQFVGRGIKKEPPTFKGACFSMGLMAVKFEGNTCLVSLTQTGKDFAIEENPVINQQKFDSAFSKPETEFILGKIIPKFPLENRIVKKILNELKDKSLTSNELEKIVANEKIEYYSEKDGTLSKKRLQQLQQTTIQERVATMGRLSELGKVDWQIDSQGKSLYALM